MKKKKTITLTLIGLFIFLFGIIGLTYAYWQLTLTQKDENLVYTDCLKLTTSLTNEGSFQLTDAYPMTNNELVSDFFPTQAPYHFTITNECDNEVPISINMESLTPSNAPYLKDDYVDIILWEGNEEDHMIQGETQVLSKVGSRIEIGSTEEKPNYKLTDHKINQDKIITEANTAYQIYKFTLPGKKAESTDNTKEFNLLLFMDYATPVSTAENQTNNAHWAGKITLNNYEVKPTLIETIKALAVQEEDSGNSGIYKVEHNDANITWDGTEDQKANLLQTEFRYAGKDPNNYVDFGEKYANDIYTFNDVEYGPYGEYDSIESCQENNVDYEGTCEIIHHQGEPLYWRIIGLVNTPEGQRIKLISDESIGEFSWDNSSTEINDGNGVNEWSESDLMKLLNSGYDTNPLESSDGTIQPGQYVNNSLYWTGGTGKCYKGDDNVDCDFTNKKMPDSLKNMIEEVIWNTGAGDENYKTEGTVSKFYEYERSNNKGDLCKLGGVYYRCNDDIERKTSWQGKVGLMYPSDYGYATSGGSTGRAACLATEIYNWDDYADCGNNDWLLQIQSWNTWTLSPISQTSRTFSVPSAVLIVSGENLTLTTARAEGRVLPSTYLKSDVVVVSGDGSKLSPYVLSGN